MPILKLSFKEGENYGKVITLDSNKVTRFGTNPKNDVILKGE